jgi:DNA-binding MurR/RpiR family transcriptional regulator
MGEAVPVGSLEQRLRRVLDGLPPSERRLALVLLAAPGEAATHSATELAGRAGVSKAAATRLVRRLGYAGWDDLRRQVRETRQWGAPLYQLSPWRAAGGRSGELARHLERDLANLARSLEGLDSHTVDGAIRALVGARRVWIMGLRNSYMLAFYARRQLVLVKDDVRLLPVPGQTMAEDLAGVTEADVVLAIGFRRRMGALGRAMQAARAAGARIVYLTDPSEGERRARADWTLVCQVQGAWLFDSYVAAISLLNYLCSAIARATGEAGRDRLERIERLHQDLDELA